MTKIYNNPKEITEFPSSVEEYLDYALDGVTDTSGYGDSRAEISNGNYLDLLKLIASKLCAANIISEQELLYTLGHNNSYRSTYFKADD